MEIPLAVSLASGPFKELIEEDEKARFWTLESSFFTINTSSILLHKKVGFRVVGMREKIAQLNGVWHDTVIMEIRSNIKHLFSS